MSGVAVPFFYRRNSCASILEEKGACKRSYCLYFRGERESSNGATASILKEKGTLTRATPSILGGPNVSNRATASILVLNRVSGVGAVPFF